MEVCDRLDDVRLRVVMAEKEEKGRRRRRMEEGSDDDKLGRGMDNSMITYKFLEDLISHTIC